MAAGILPMNLCSTLVRVCDGGNDGQRYLRRLFGDLPGQSGLTSGCTPAGCGTPTLHS